MNAVGKILVMLNFVMSLVFMAFAVSVYSVHKNWEEVVKGPQPGAPQGLLGQISDLQQKRDRLQSQYNELKREIDREVKLEQQRIAVLETERENQLEKVKTLETQLTQITEDKTKTTAAIDAAIAEVGKKSAETQLMSEEIEKQRAVIDDLNKQILAYLNQIAKLNTDLAKLQDQMRVLVAGNSSAGGSAAQSAEPPKVEGHVVAASNDFVQISLGSDDGVKKGHTFEVYRPGATADATKYLGRIEILQTEPDVAVGKVMTDFRRGNIEKNDRVATRLN